MPIDAFVPVLAGEDVPAGAPAGLGPRLDLGDRLAEDPVLDHLPLAVQLLESLGERLCRLVVGREQELERDLRAHRAGRRR